MVKESYASQYRAQKQKARGGIVPKLGANSAKDFAENEAHAEDRSQLNYYVNQSNTRELELNGSLGHQ
jgi:hypothetical protein